MDATITIYTKDSTTQPPTVKNRDQALGYVACKFNLPVGNLVIRKERHWELVFSCAEVEEIDGSGAEALAILR